MPREYVTEPCDYDTRDVLIEHKRELVIMTKNGLLLVTQEMWWKLCDHHLWEPIKLQDADLNEPFVYDRKFGFFYVSMGHHFHVMRFLLGLHLKMGYNELQEHMTKEKGEYSVHFHADCYADYYLETIEGTAFRSSVGKKIYYGSKKMLNHKEKETFADIGLEEI